MLKYSPGSPDCKSSSITTTRTIRISLCIGLKCVVYVEQSLKMILCAMTTAEPPYQDTLGTRKNVLVTGFLGVKMYTNMVFRDSNSVLFIKVSLFQSVLLSGIPLIINLHIYM